MSGRRRKLEPACAHELARWYPPVSRLDRFLCRWLGHQWEPCFLHRLAWCRRCDKKMRGN